VAESGRGLRRLYLGFVVDIFASIPVSNFRAEVLKDNYRRDERRRTEIAGRLSAW
jgi:hypothetical protein